MYRNKLISIVLSFLLGAISFEAYAYEDGDFQIWHTENQEIKISNETKATFEEEFRWGDDATDFYYHHYDYGIMANAGKYISVGVNYRQVYEQKKWEFKTENRPHVNLALKYELWGFKLEDRNRFEYRHFDYQDDSCRYRNKATIKLPVNIAKIEVAPYVADEIFISTNGSGLDRNRLYSGLEIGITKNIKADIYYLLQAGKSSGKWSDINALGTKLKIIF